MIKNLLSNINREGVCTPETQQQRGEKILPFVTQYQPSVPTLKEVLMKKWNLTQNQPAKFLKNQEERKILKGHVR